MSEFIANNLHKKVDHIMDVFFGAGVASHPTIIEQINYLLFMRALSQRDDELRQLGVTNDNEIVFDGELEKYHWDNLLTLNAEALFNALDECFRKIPESTTNKTVRLVFRNAHIKLFDKPSLRTVLHLIDEFGKAMDESEHEGKRDVFGDTYEYLLSKLAQAGTSGQFRTPRHIIEFIVNVVAPKKGETIIDPAVGTAGFLVKAYEYLRKEYTSPETFETGGSFDKLSNKEHTFLLEHTFTGFDSDEDMIKFGMMNLYLHGLKDAKLVRQNTLTDTAGSRDKYDIILANPPFSGKIDRDSVAEELQMNTGATEILFLRYMMRHLTDNGRVGVIVPEGVLFNSSGAHTKIREQLLENGLWCVVSLPSGVFNPYAGVKTSILFFDKSRQDKQEVLFAKIENDGFSLGAQRRAITKNDLPEIIADIKRFQLGEGLQTEQAYAVSYERIRETKDFNLTGDRYKIGDAGGSMQYPMVKLGEYVNYVRGLTYSKKDEVHDKGIKVLRANNIDLPSSTLNLDDIKQISTSVKVKDSQKLQVGDIFVCAASGSKQHIGKVAYINQDTDCYFGGFMAAIRTNEKLNSKFLFYLLRSSAFNAYLQSRISSASINNLNAGILNEYEIPLPPLEVQQKIVADIENKQKAIDHAREIIQVLERERAYFDPSTRATRENWPVVKLSDIADVRDGTHDSPKYVTDGYPLVTSKNIKNGTIDFTDTNYISQKDFDLINKRSGVDGGDIIMPMIGTIGGAVCVQKDRDFAIKNVALLKPSGSKINFDYLVTMLNSKYVNDRFAVAASGATQKFVSLGFIRSLGIPLPSPETQREIVTQFAEEDEIIAANRKLIKIYEQKIAQAISEI